MKENKAIRLFKPATLLISLLLIAAAIYSYYYVEGFRAFTDNAKDILLSRDEKRIEEWVKPFGFWGPITLIGGYIAQMILFVIPSWLLIIVTILAYGPFLGSLIALAGIFLEASLAFMIGKLISENTLKKFSEVKTKKKINIYLNRYSYKLIVLLRLSPFVSNDTVSFTAGFIGLKYRKFIAATIAGITPLIILTAIIGLRIENLKTPFIIITALNIIGFIAYVIWDRKNNNRRL